MSNFRVPRGWRQKRKTGFCRTAASVLGWDWVGNGVKEGDCQSPTWFLGHLASGFFRDSVPLGIGGSHKGMGGGRKTKLHRDLWSLKRMGAERRAAYLEILEKYLSVSFTHFRFWELVSGHFTQSFGEELKMSTWSGAFGKAELDGVPIAKAGILCCCDDYWEI